MPFVKVEWMAGRSDEQKASLAGRITDAVCDVTGVGPDDVWIVFADVPAGDWALGGRLQTPKQPQ